MKLTRLVAAAVLLSAGYMNSSRAQQNGQPIAKPADTAVAPGLDNAATDQNHDGQPDVRWPMVTKVNDGQITVFEPQLESLQGNQLNARAAVSLQKSDDKEPIFGAIWMSSRVSTDRVARTVEVLDVKITKSHFPNDVQSIDAKALETQLTNAITSQPIQLSLDQLLAMMNDVQQEQANSEDLKTDAPKVIFREHPAVLVQYDGQPKAVDVDGAGGVQRIANTPFFVAVDTQNKQYFLKGAGRWFEARDPLGPFKSISQVPAEISKLAVDENYKDPTTTQPSMTPEQQAKLEIVAATEPTELVWTDGPPTMTPIEGTNLLFVQNTDADWLVDVDSQRHFLLLSGRWYSTLNRGDEWAFFDAEKLPADFKKIPPNSEKGDVLAQVPGTAAADEAIADTYVPQTATVDRKTFDQPKVEYDGEPQFQPAEGTDASYAVNTYDPVLQYGGNYYLCSNAVWYVGHAARGPWELCSEVPDNFYRVRPNCPIYGVRYCHVYGATAEAIYVGYTPGYVGCYPFRRTVVYGTGYRYQPWCGRRYYARPTTFGYAAHYNSYVGHWGFNFALATGNSGQWIGRSAHDFTRRDVVFGYGGYRPVVLHRDVNRSLFRNDYLARVREERGQRPLEQREDLRRDNFARNVYERRNDVKWETFRRADAEESRRDHPGDAFAGDAARRAEETRRTEATAHPAGNNVFVDRDGNVYRRGEDGRWEQRDRGAWKPNAETGTPANESGNARPAGPQQRPSNPQPTARPGDPQPTGKPGDPQPTARPGEPRAGEPRGTGKPGDPQPGEPRKPTPVNPAPPVNNAELDRAAKAREVGDSRLRGYERPAASTARPAAPAPRPAPSPRPAPAAPNSPPAGKGNGR